MRFLKSILSSKNSKEKNEMVIEELQTALSGALDRIDNLEKQVSSSSIAIVELSQAVNNIAQGTKNLSEEFLVVTTLLQQASEAMINEKDSLLPKAKDKDDDGYLN